MIPYPYQLEGARFLAAHEGGCLFDEPGLGKTLTAILAAELIGARHILVACPSVVKRHWQKSFNGHGQAAAIVEGFAKRTCPAGIVIVSHAAVANFASLGRLVASGPWDLIIVDEADEFRNIRSKRSQAMFGTIPMALWRHARYVWPLTGTPYVNTAADLYPIMSSILARRLGAVPSYLDFCQRYTLIGYDQAGEWVPKGIQHADELYRAMRPHFLARRAEGLVALPPLRIETFPVDVSPEELRTIVGQLEGLTPARVARSIAAEDEPETPIMRVRHALGLAKAPAAAAYLDHLLRIKAGPLVAFFIHTDVRAAIVEALPEATRIGLIDGSNSGKAGDTAEVFQAGGYDILMIQIRAGGVGITLTRAHRCVVVEQPWTARDVEQAVKRIHRISQTVPVLAEVLYAQGCWLDELAARLIAEKASAAAAMLGHG